MMKQFRYMDPEMIMTIVVSLIVLAVGVYAFLVTASQVTNMNPYTTPSATTSTVQNHTYYSFREAINNSTTTGNQVFNIVGIVLIIGAIMTIVGLVYSYVKPGGY